MKRREKQSIAEYLGEFREIKPKLMQREQRLQGESKPAPAESADGGQASAFVAKHRHFGSSGGSTGSSREHAGSSDSRSCYGCGETGHIKLNCKFRNAECENCGKRGHTKAVCRQPARRAERAYAVKEGADVRGVAFTAWRGGAGAQTEVWLVDSGSTQHITGDRRKFVSYKKLAQPEVIDGIGGEPLTAVGVGMVELQCRTPKGVGTVTLYEVRHVPKARANLFALRRVTDAGARVTTERRVAQFELGGVVCMEAEEKNGL
ncbi:hypothetical protein KFL_013080040 [Klebsormidium nitens]|uniref:CCHC-type domain-containing protein n=1 Tax=Klebsormidium nitens TaxID=105231 RepID=A0A1Y1IWK4_KLENI|nr:hypothetical protein KFL_013080040 [Klebsormidium nitens]|eukprot:GAQ93117.1 hypothetical protein KFL_013080040 [Klebsormidium nitens]